MGYMYILGNVYVGYGYVNGLFLIGVEYDWKGRDFVVEVMGGSVWY